jgi:hypothetical protein
MPRETSFQCNECRGFKDLSHGCLNPLRWEFKGSPVLIEWPTIDQQLDKVVKLQPITLRQLIKMRKRIREQKRRYRARAQAEYLTTMVKA